MTPPPLTASRNRPARARKPRRDVASATASLRRRLGGADQGGGGGFAGAAVRRTSSDTGTPSPRSEWPLSIYGPGRGHEHALELVERVERSLRQHLSVRREHDRVRAPGNRELAPGIGVLLLVEDLELDLRVGRDEPERGLERPAERTARRAEHSERQRSLPLEALDQADVAAELRSLVLERQRNLRSDGEPELAELPCKREHRDREQGEAGEGDGEADPQPRLGRRPSVRHERKRGESSREDRCPSDGSPTDRRARAETAAGRAGAAARDRDD